MKNATKAGKYRCGYCYMDIKFYQEDKELWKIDNMDRQKYTVYKSDFYPLHLRPFGTIWLPAPKDTRLFLLNKYKSFECKTGHYNHVQEKVKKVVSVSNCSVVLDYYPHVVRTRHEHGKRGVVETLLFQNRTLHRVLVDEQYHDTYYSLQ